MVLATTQQYLRFITIGGIQTQINHLPGSVVTMAMHEKQLLVVYKRAGGLFIVLLVLLYLIIIIFYYYCFSFIARKLFYLEVIILV